MVSLSTELDQRTVDEDGCPDISQHTGSLPSTLSPHTPPPSDKSPNDSEIWQGVQLLENIPDFTFLSGPHEDTSQTWGGFSQILDKPVLMASSGDHFEEDTWLGISGSLQNEYSQRSTELADDTKWSGLSGHSDDDSESTFHGISSQYLSGQYPAGQDASNQFQGKTDFFWRLRADGEEARMGFCLYIFLFLCILQMSTPNKGKGTAKTSSHHEREDSNDSTSSSDDTPRYYRTKKSADRISSLLKQVPVTKHRSPDVLVLQRRVRQRTKEILDHKKDVPTLTGHPALLPTRFEVKRYESTKDPQHGPSIAAFKIEISDKCRTPWNKRLAVVFAEDLIANGNYGYTKEDHEKIVEVFLTHLKFLRNNYIRSEENAIPQVQLDEDKARARDARRRALYLRRLNICQHYIDDVSMQNLLDVLKNVNYKVCSGDESARDRGKMRYAIVQPVWRNPQLHFQFRILDRLHLSTRITQEDRFTRGAPPRVRVTTDRIDHADPIPGLPQNFYSPVYLAGLPQYKRDALNIQPPREIFISEDMRRVADEHARLTSVETPALPEHGLTNSPFFYR